jgi:transposase
VSGRVSPAERLRARTCLRDLGARVRWAWSVFDRHDLTDAEWARLEPLLPDRTPRRGGRWLDHRQVINGILWRTRTGAPWRDVPPPCYGDYRTLHGRHRRWSADGTWERILAAWHSDSDSDAGAEWVVGIDSTVVRAHRHAASARHAPPLDVPAERLAPLLPEPVARSTAASAPASATGGEPEDPRSARQARRVDREARGRSRGGLTTKIHLLADTRCRPLVPGPAARRERTAVRSARAPHPAPRPSRRPRPR